MLLPNVKALRCTLKHNSVFEAPIVLEWEKSVRAAGNELPIRIGIPGPATIDPLDSHKFRELVLQCDLFQNKHAM